MVDKDYQSYPLAPANGHARSDTESGCLTKEERRQRNKKRILYLIAFVIFQIGVITLFSLTVMKFRNPKFRVRSNIAVENISGVSANSQSFSMTLNGQFGVKNTNFGPFKYDNSTVTFFYRNTPVGSSFVAKGRAKFLSTKKINFSAPLTGSGDSLSSDIAAGIIPLTSSSRLSGKVTIMFLMKKKRSATMNCTMDFVIATSMIQNLKCK